MLHALMQSREDAQKFAQQHLRECALELQEIRDTGMLRNGRVRELAKLCAAFCDGSQALTIAESIVVRACIDSVAEQLQA